MKENRKLAVALCGIEPATFEHCALIRDWLDERGVTRVTLSVIPAADHHPFYQRSPALVTWLHARRDAGDGIAQQGFVARAAGRRAAAEHARAGRRLMERAGLKPSGYRAPGLAHAFGARRDLMTSYDWWIAPGLWRAGTVLHRSSTLFLDIHPEDFDQRASRIHALERVLATEAARRVPVTYADLVVERGRSRAEAPALRSA